MLKTGRSTLMLNLWRWTGRLSLVLVGSRSARARGKSSGVLPMFNPEGWTSSFPHLALFATFIWTFVDSEGGTKITQRADLSGPDAKKYIDFTKALEAGIPAGIRKLCEAMHESRAGGAEFSA
jgi:hypothetical protein